MSATQSLRPGVYAPILTHFQTDGTEQICFESFNSNIARLGKAGVGILIGGTLGEGPFLERDERIALIKSARETLKGLKLESIPIISGVTGSSVRECISQAKDAGSAGADAIIVVAPAYFSFVYGKNKPAIKDFFTSIADQSPVPMMIYNIPFAAGGIDLDADFLVDISEHQNIAGVKLTCFNIAKGYRVALHVNSAEYRARHPLPFLVLPGCTDYLLPAILGRQHGCIGGPANLYPKLCVKIFETGKKAMETGNMELLLEAQKLQDIVTEADSVINNFGFVSIKTAMGIHVDKSLAGVFRKPLYRLEDEGSIQELRTGLAKAFEVENSL
ncbi:unnamed protein product [Clonostachys byssicola]|uniref:Uncharacterized protein n=1 Tax=Clonostachys byssicola TaxID=160290 RepID=A0A9N9UWE3_9HYPO|nr:unnamed protein product [Clonostachys byssicola]